MKNYPMFGGLVGSWMTVRGMNGEGLRFYTTFVGREEVMLGRIQRCWN